MESRNVKNNVLISFICMFVPVMLAKLHLNITIELSIIVIILPISIIIRYFRYL